MTVAQTDASTETLARSNAAGDEAQNPDARLLIEPAESRDSAAVAEMVRSSASWYEEFLDPKDMDEHEVDQEWAEKNFEKRDFFVGREEDEPVGTVSLQDAGDYAYLGYVYVHEKHVGKRYGHELLRFAEAEARDRGYKGLVLIAHPEAVWAVKAYEKFGFEAIETVRERVLAWNNGWLKPYYEEGFHLFRLEF